MLLYLVSIPTCLALPFPGLANPETVGKERPQPTCFEGKLKHYQLKVKFSLSLKLFDLTLKSVERFSSLHCLKTLNLISKKRYYLVLA